MKRRQRLYSERIKRRMTQSEVASLIGISRVAYSNVENGVCGTTADRWDMLEDEFGVKARLLRVVTESKTLPKKECVHRYEAAGSRK